MPSLQFSKGLWAKHQLGCLQSFETSWIRRHSWFRPVPGCKVVCCVPSQSWNWNYNACEISVQRAVLRSSIKTYRALYPPTFLLAHMQTWPSSFYSKVSAVVNNENEPSQTSSVTSPWCADCKSTWFMEDYISNLNSFILMDFFILFLFLSKSTGVGTVAFEERLLQMVRVRNLF